MTLGPRRGVHRGGGTYVVGPLTSGRHELRVIRLGYAMHVDTLVLSGEGEVIRSVVLQPRAVPLSQVVISPGVYGAFDVQAPSLQLLERDDLLRRPQLAEDLFRSLNRMPGMAGSDFSAKLRIRNSHADEVLVTLDGMELIEPYHMKDFDGALTVVDQDAIERVEVNTGGFGAQFGTRGAGVVRMESAVPARDRTAGAVGVSLSNIRARSEGRFHAGKGAWLVSARRGYLDIVLKLINQDEGPDPTYYDVFARIQRTVGTRHVAALHTLVANDALTFSVDEGVTNARGRYGNAYLWGTLRSQWTDRLQSTTLASVAGLSWVRSGQEAEFLRGMPTVRAGFDDQRDLNLLGIKQDWVWDVGPAATMLFGVEGRQEGASYDYRQFAVRRASTTQGPIVLDSMAWRLVRTVDGYRQSGYSALRLRPVRVLAVEVGARADRHSWTRETTVTPRSNLRWDVGARTIVRAAWGQYTQAQGLQDLSVVDGDSVFSRAERSEQRVVGLEHRTRSGWSGRVEVFERRMRHPRPRWHSIDGELDPFPEGQLDRVHLTPDSSDVRGAEVTLAFDVGGRVRASGWYAHTRGRSHYGSASSPRPYEEPHAGAIDLIYRSRTGWHWAAAWTFHTGWPGVAGAFVLDTVGAGQFAIRRLPPTPVFTERLGAYQRLDLRASRRFVRGAQKIEVFAEVFNLLDRKNQRGWSYDVTARNGRVQVSRVPEAFIGRLPTAGVRWTF